MIFGLLQSCRWLVNGDIGLLRFYICRKTSKLLTVLTVHFLLSCFSSFDNFFMQEFSHEISWFFGACTFVRDNRI